MYPFNLIRTSDVIKRTLLDEIDSTNYANTFVAHNIQKGEIWVSYPTVGSTFCNKALIYNYNTSSFISRFTPTLPLHRDSIFSKIHKCSLEFLNDS